ncbi:hypothetical protein [Sinomonas atrocyanea]|uniref:hypothetical protein n=1 Tax=Sinomonas atrocyanea TaxID=37927 RepID=UPI003D96EB7F
MDPTTLFRTLWHHKWVALPVVLLTALGCLYVFTTDRTYVSSASYAMISPQLPTDRQMELDPNLAKVNRDNPYLRSSDVLLSQVLIRKLSDKPVAEELVSKGLSGEYAISPGTPGQGFGLILQIEASARTAEQATATVNELGKRLDADLYAVQKVRGADDSSLITAEPVTAPNAEESFSSRLRTMIIVAVAGTVVLFSSVSVARALELAASRRRGRRARSAVGAAARPGEVSSVLIAPSSVERATELDSAESLRPPLVPTRLRHVGTAISGRE